MDDTIMNSLDSYDSCMINNISITFCNSILDNIINILSMSRNKYARKLIGIKNADWTVDSFLEKYCNNNFSTHLLPDNLIRIDKFLKDWYLLEDGTKYIYE